MRNTATECAAWGHKWSYSDPIHCLRCDAFLAEVIERERVTVDDTDHHDQDDDRWEIVNEEDVMDAALTYALARSGSVGAALDDIMDDIRIPLTPEQQRRFAAAALVSLAARAEVVEAVAAAVEARDKDWHDAITQVRGTPIPLGRSVTMPRTSAARNALDEVLRLMEGK